MEQIIIMGFGCGLVLRTIIPIRLGCSEWVDLLRVYFSFLFSLWRFVRVLVLSLALNLRYLFDFMEREPFVAHS
jgi:hypothetical protein